MCGWPFLILINCCKSSFVSWFYNIQLNEITYRSTYNFLNLYYNNLYNGMFVQKRISFETDRTRLLLIPLLHSQFRRCNLHFCHNAELTYLYSVKEKTSEQCNYLTVTVLPSLNII